MEGLADCDYLWIFFDINPKNEKACVRIHRMPSARARPQFRTLKRKIPDSLDAPPVGAIVAYTDGACSGNGRPGATGGFAVVLPEFPGRTGGWPLADGVVPTSNRAEFTAFLKAARLADAVDPPGDGGAGGARTLLVVTDSQLLHNAASKWIPKWKKAGWVKSDGAPVANRDLCEAIAAACERRAIVTRHIRAHGAGADPDSVGNRLADKLAGDACATQRRAAAESSS